MTARDRQSSPTKATSAATQNRPPRGWLDSLATDRRNSLRTDAAILRRRGYTTAQIATALGITRRTVERWEHR